LATGEWERAWSEFSYGSESVEAGDVAMWEDVPLVVGYARPLAVEVEGTAVMDDGGGWRRRESREERKEKKYLDRVNTEIEFYFGKSQSQSQLFVVTLHTLRSVRAPRKKAIKLENATVNALFGNLH
jgi:hypothetical protein